MDGNFWYNGTRDFNLTWLTTRTLSKKSYYYVFRPEESIRRIRPPTYKPNALLAHIPDHISSLIGSFYRNSSISVGTSDCITKSLVVEKGILQGDSISPLIFNMCFHTLIRIIENEQIKLMGYNYTNALSPCHWFQLADDTALATTIEEGSQALLNVFAKWCQWSNLKIYIDKCIRFDSKKNGKQLTQFRPCLKVNNEMVSAIKLSDYFLTWGNNSVIICHVKMWYVVL